MLVAVGTAKLRSMFAAIAAPTPRIASGSPDGVNTTGAGAGAGCVGVIDFVADCAAGFVPDCVADCVPDCVATLAPGRTISAVTSARGAPSGL